MYSQVWVGLWEAADVLWLVITTSELLFWLPGSGMPAGHNEEGLFAIHQKALLNWSGDQSESLNVPTILLSDRLASRRDQRIVTD